MHIIVTVSVYRHNLAQTQKKLKFCETQLSAFGAKPRRIREQDVPLDAACSKALAVITSLRAAIDRRDCSIIALKAQLETDQGSRVPAAAGTLVAQRFQHSKLRALIQAWFAESSRATVIRRLTWRKESKLKAIAWQGWIQLLHFGDHQRHQLRSTWLYDVGSDNEQKVIWKVAFQQMQWAWQKWGRSLLVDRTRISVKVQVVPIQRELTLYGSLESGDFRISEAMASLTAGAPELASFAPLRLSYIDAADPLSPRREICSFTPRWRCVSVIPMSGT
jgi:hypothetical protein